MGSAFAHPSRGIDIYNSIFLKISDIFHAEAIARKEKLTTVETAEVQRHSSLDPGPFL